MLVFLLVKGNENLNDFRKTHHLSDTIQFYEARNETKGLPMCTCHILDLRVGRSSTLIFFFNDMYPINYNSFSWFTENTVSILSA